MVADRTPWSESAPPPYGKIRRQALPHRQKIRLDRATQSNAVKYLAFSGLLATWFGMSASTRFIAVKCTRLARFGGCPPRRVKFRPAQKNGENQMKRFAKWLIVPALMLAAWGATSSTNQAEAGWGYYRRPILAPRVHVVRPYPVYRTRYHAPPVYYAPPVYPIYPAYVPGFRLNIGVGY